MSRVHYALSLISIHAPTRGATLREDSVSHGKMNFNPRSYKRSDQRLGVSFYDSSDFNPRSYKRSDLQ